MKKSIKRASKLIGVAMILSLLLVLLPVSTAVAGSLTSVSDTLTTYATGAAPKQTIAFTTVTEIPTDGTIAITFPSGFDISSIVDGDVAETLTAGSATWAVSEQVLTGTVATAAVTAGAQSIVIGDGAAAGLNDITSPSAASTYTVSISTSAGDTGSATVDLRYLSASDTLSGTDPYYKSASNNHTVVFRAATGFTAAGSDDVISVDLSAFTTTSLVIGDVAVTALKSSGAITYTIDATTPSATGHLGYALAAGVMTLKFFDTDTVEAGQFFKIVLSNAHVTNPGTTGQKSVTVSTKDGSTTIDTATCKVRIIDGLTQDLYEAKDTLSGFNATRLTADVAASGTVLPVEDASGFAQYDRILLRQGDTQDEIAIVSSADTTANTITVTRGDTSLSWDSKDVIEVLELSDITNSITFKNATQLISELKKVEVIFGGDFAADHGTVTNAADFGSISGLPGSGSLTVVDGVTLQWSWGSGQNLSADTTCSFTLTGESDTAMGVWQLGDLTADGPLTSNEYPVTINLLDTDDDVVDTVTVLITLDEVTSILAIVPEALTYGMGSTTAPSGGTIHTGSVTLIDFGTLVDDTAKTAVIEIEVDTNATYGYVVNVIGDATLKSVTDPSNDTIAAVSGSNASPAAWPTVDSSTTSAYGYHSSDEALESDTADRFSAADTYAALSGTASLVTDNTGPVAGSDAGSTADSQGHHEITIKVEVDTLQEAGTYQGTMTFIVTPTF
ncbi:MAG: hypothetical protein ISS53_01555 [Dehalococcoidia bacterium]|nr:hypothetical protein [Dehalococcoidia bacterium]